MADNAWFEILVKKEKSGQGTGDKTIIFCVLKRGGNVLVSIVTGVNAESLLSEMVTKVLRGSIVGTNTWSDLKRAGAKGTICYCPQER